MTQVKEWSNQELNRKLAELMGFSIKKAEGYNEYQVILLEGSTYGLWTETEEEAWSYAPEYCTDPAASLEVQTAAIAKDADAYLSNLFDATCDSDKPVWTTKVVARMLTATPRERAEAAFETLSQVSGQ